MRHGRSKAARKTLQYFGRTIGLKAPYSILLDATFVATLFQQKILPLKPRLDKVLQTAPNSYNKYCITEAAVDELRQILEGLEARNHVKAPAFREALEWVRKECCILKSKTVPQEDETEDSNPKKRKQRSALSTPAQHELLQNLENDETPYIVASQDDELLAFLRQKGVVPIVRLANHTVLLLEQPSKQSHLQSKGMEQQKWRNNLPEAEKALVDLVKTETRKNSNLNHETTPQQPPRPRIKKAKGPNPLSCKRKQSSESRNKEESTSKKRRKRAHKKESNGETSN